MDINTFFCHLSKINIKKARVNTYCDKLGELFLHISKKHLKQKEEIKAYLYNVLPVSITINIIFDLSFFSNWFDQYIYKQHQQYNEHTEKIKCT